MRFLTRSGLLATWAALCGCSQSSTTDPASEAPAATVAVANEHCPIMGGDVTAAGGTTEWSGQTIGFCCPGCIDKWNPLSDEEKQAALAKVKDRSHDHEHHDHDNEPVAHEAS